MLSPQEGSVWMWEILIQNKLFAPARIILPFFRTGENVLVLNSSSLMVVAVVVVKWLFQDGCHDGFLITMQISHVVLLGVKHLKKETCVKSSFPNSEVSNVKIIIESKIVSRHHCFYYKLGMVALILSCITFVNFASG